MAIIHDIVSAKAQSRKLLVLLIDPEKQSSIHALQPYLSLPDMIFVGGSTGNQCQMCVTELKQHTSRPIILFPGNIDQFTEKADALLFLSVLTSRLPQLLIEPHIQMAATILQSGIEVIPMGYLLIDGGRKSSVEIATNAQSLPQTDISSIVQTAVAGQLLGKQLIYLEAGSGAKTPVSSDIIRAVRKQLQIPLIVGGGITTPEAMMQAYEAGADIVVIGNHFELHPTELPEFIRIKQAKYPPSPLPNSESSDIRYMQLALAEAQKAFALGEVPVGCVIVADGQIVGRGHNLTETLADVTAHAEMQAITAATNTLGGKYLSQCTLYVTVEPCVMCVGAIGWAQIRRVVYGATDEKRGFTFFAPKALHPKCTISSGVLEPECRQLMQSFFASKR